MAKKSFIKGAAILGAAGLLVKILGAILIIPMGHIIGATGMAYYTPAYNVYAVFIVIGTSGIPVAISRMVSERMTIGEFEEAHRVFRISSMMMMIIGVVSFVILFFGSGFISTAIKLPQSKLAMMSIAPALIVVPIMAAYRGYFQGMQNMIPTAFSQVIEQVFRVIFGLSLGYFFYKAATGTGIFANYESAAKGAAGATFGATIGAVGGLAVILFIYGISKKMIKGRRRRSAYKEHESSKSILKQILIIAVPITVGATIVPIINFIEAPLVMSRLLATGWDNDVATNLYGQIGGYVNPIINMPQVLTMALSMSLVPLISAAHKRKDKAELQHNASLSLRVAMIIGLPCAVGLATLSEPILLLLYSNRAEEAINVAPTMAIFAIGIIFLALIQTVSGVLQGIGKQMIPVINMCIGIVIKIVVTLLLVGVHSLNIKGAAIGTVSAYFVVAFLDLYATKKYTGIEFDITLTFIKPGISTAVMGLSALFVYYIIFGGGQGNKIACLFAMLMAVIVYVIMIFVTKSITRKDLENIPKGNKIIKILDKLRVK